MLQIALYRPSRARVCARVVGLLPCNIRHKMPYRRSIKGHTSHLSQWLKRSISGISAPRPPARRRLLLGHLGRRQGDAVKHAAVARVLAFVAALFEAIGEGLVAAGMLASVLGPLLPRLIEFATRRRIDLVDGATLADPGRDQILFGEIGLAGLADDLGRGEPDLLPFEATLQRPVEDPRPFRLELLEETLVALCGRDRHREGDEVKSAPHRLIDTAQRGFVV